MTRWLENKKLWADGINYTFARRLAEWYFGEALRGFITNPQNKTFDIYLYDDESMSEWTDDTRIEFFKKEWLACEIIRGDEVIKFEAE